MARTNRDKTWRQNIQISMLVNRLYQNAIGKLDLTKVQQKSIEILLKKLVPDLRSVEHTGKDGEPIQNDVTVRYVD